MKGIHYLCLGICVLYLFYISESLAGIVVIPNLINLASTDLPRTDVAVTNDGDEEAYVKITPHVILDSGTDHERKVIIRNPQQYGLLVTPQQIIIPPKQRRLVRFMLTRPFDEHEHIYRIDIVPVAKDLIPTHTFKKNNKNMGLQMLVGYGVLVMVRPEHPLFNIDIHREGKNLFLKNKGNANIELSNIEQCIGNTCHPVKNFVRLYSGNSNRLLLKYSAPVKMVAQLLEEQKLLTSN